LRGAHDTPSLLAGSVQAAPSCVFPPFHLDEGQPFAFQGHEVNLSDRRPVAACYDAIALEAKQGRGKRLGEDPASIRLDPRAALLNRASG
jgi:hypothetical protein